MKKIWLAILMISVMGITKADFYRLEKDPASLPAGKFYPEGRILPFGGYGPPAAAELKSWGFSMAGPAQCYIQDVIDFARDAKTAGLSCAFHLGTVYKDGVINIDRFNKMSKDDEKLDWDLIEKDMVKTVKQARSDKEIDDNISWWVIAAEELRYWRQDEYRHLQLYCKVIRRLDERKRPITMYIPGHYELKDLQKYTPYLDIIMQGFYPYAGKADRVWMRSWANNMMDVVKTAPHKVMPAIVPEMFVEPKPENIKMIPAWVRHDVYMPLIYGCKAVVVFSLIPKIEFPSHGEYLKAFTKAAKEVGQGGLGEVFLFGKRCSKLKCKVISGPKTVTYRQGDKVVGTYPTIKLADIKHSSGRYAMGASSTRKPVKAILSGFPKEPVRLVNAEDGTVLGTSSNGQFELEFGPWGVALVKIEKAD